MADKWKKRAHTQMSRTPSGLSSSIFYTVTEISPKALKSQKTEDDAKMYYASVVPQRTLTIDDLVSRMEAERCMVKPLLAKYVLETAMETIVRALKEGERVTLGDFFSFGVSLKGRIDDPKHPDAKKRLEVHPWVRCSKQVFDAVNKDAHLAELGRTKVAARDLFSGLRDARTRPAREKAKALRAARKAELAAQAAAQEAETPSAESPTEA